MDTNLQEMEESCQIIKILAIKHVKSLRIYEEEQFFCGHNILTESVFLQPNCVAMREITVWRMVWVGEKCCFMNYI